MEIEEAKSGRSICVDCKNIIQRGTMRLITEDYNYGTNNKRFRCLKCGKYLIEDEIIERENLLKQIKWLEKNKN